MGTANRHTDRGAKEINLIEIETLSRSPFQVPQSVLLHEESRSVIRLRAQTCLRFHF